MAKPTITILSTTSTPQGVGVKVLVQLPDQEVPVEFDLMVVQIEDQSLSMNWRTTTAWRAWAPSYDASFDFEDALALAEEVVMPVALQIWRTLPTYQEPSDD